MTWNNVALLSIWAMMCWACGTARFFTIYLISTSMAGAAGIILFTVQHNFAHSYASDTSHWDYEMGAIEGSSFLILPRWLNWFTANIAYHHLHHLSPKFPTTAWSRATTNMRICLRPSPACRCCKFPQPRSTSYGTSARSRSFLSPSIGGR